MDISVYFDPIDLTPFQDSRDSDNQKRIGNIITSFTEKGKFPFPDSSVDIAIIGVCDDRRAFGNKGCAGAPDAVRNCFYRLFEGTPGLKIFDLGNIRAGHKSEDTYFAVRDTLAALMAQNVLPIVIGGGQDLTFANYLAYESLGKIINIVAVDPAFDLGHEEDPLSSYSYLSKIITHQPNFLFNYTNIGYQTYFVEKDAVDLMKKLYFDAYRLGIVHADTEEVEPMVRNADMLTVDIGAVRQPDAPGNSNATPNGFYGEEMCRIMRYAGLSDKLSSLGIYEINPNQDKNGQTAMLAAQMIWYFIDGYGNRKNDFPIREKKYYLKYRVAIKELDDEIVFYKSKKSGRWWMEVPCPTNLKSKYERHYLVPCSYGDYQTACKEEIPDRWWQAFQKIM